MPTIATTAQLEINQLSQVREGIKKFINQVFIFRNKCKKVAPAIIEEIRLQRGLLPKLTTAPTIGPGVSPEMGIAILQIRSDLSWQKLMRTELDATRSEQLRELDTALKAQLEKVVRPLDFESMVHLGYDSANIASELLTWMFDKQPVILFSQTEGVWVINPNLPGTLIIPAKIRIELTELNLSWERTKSILGRVDTVSQLPPLKPKDRADRKESAQAKELRKRELIIKKAVRNGLTGKNYCIFVDSEGLDIRQQWREQGCPDTYEKAYTFPNTPQKLRWQGKIHDEKTRATKKTTRKSTKIQPRV